jgi:hypothetical protein
MIVERIGSRQGAQKANEGDKELPDKVDTATNAELLQSHSRYVHDCCWVFLERLR